MRIIKPWIEVVKIDGVQMMKNIEKAGKQCYRSQGNITDDSYKVFLNNCLTRGHESVIEHEKVSVRMCVDIGVYKDITRHRHASFSIESTRYCNYQKDKFGNEITFIKPFHIDETRMEYELWSNCMEQIEETYMKMNHLGCKPDQLRMLLPHSTAGELYMTANMREWRHIFQLRADKHAHPTVQQVMIPLLLYFKQEMPELFGDIAYNEDFFPCDYAELRVIE